MSIGNIKNTPLRRAVVLLAFLPFMAGVVILYGVSAIPELVEASRGAWRGNE